jgi:mono/diheme cytochrome c family protein
MRCAMVAAATLAWLALWACDSGSPARSKETQAASASIARGRALFLEHCGLCHGERANGRGVRRGSLSRPPTDFRSPLFVSDRPRIRRSIRDGVAGSDMPGWLRLGEPAVDDLTSYVLAVRSTR